MKTHSVKYNFIMKSISMVTSILVPLIVYKRVCPILQPQGVGAVNFAQSAVYYFTMIAQLGIPLYGIRECAKLRNDREALSRTACEILKLNAITCAFAYLLFFLCLVSVPQFRADQTLFLVMSASILLNVIGVEWFYSALEMYDRMMVLSLGARLLMLLGTFLLVRQQSDYVFYGAMLVLGAIGWGIVNFAALGKYIDFRAGRNGNIRKHVKPVLVFFAMSVATTVYTQMDSLMLGFMKGTVENGYYDAAVKVKMLLISLITSLGTVIMPRASYYLEQGQREAFRKVSAKAMDFVMAAAIPCCAYFLIFARPTILFLSGDSFLNSVSPMRYIMPTVILVGITNITGIQMMIPLGRENGVLKAEIAGAVVNLIVNALLIPRLGASGAAIGTVIAEVAVLIVEFLGIRDLLPEIFGNISYARILAGTAAASVVSGFLLKAELGNFLMLAVSALVFFGIYCIICAPYYRKRLKE